MISESVELGLFRRAARVAASWPVRAVVAIALLVLLASQQDASAIGNTLRQADWVLAAAGTSVVALTVLASGIRWHRVLAALESPMPAGAACRETFAGLFVGQFLPSSVGGDVYRAYSTLAHGTTLGRGIASVVSDRAMAMLPLAVMAVAGLPFATGAADPSITILLLLLTGGVIAGAAAVLTAHRWMPARLATGPASRLLHFLAANRDLFRGRVAVQVLAISVCVHLGSVLATLCFARALGVPVGYMEGLMVVPTVLLVSALPVSINGWGIREWTMIVGFGVYGVEAEAALLVSILLGLSIAVSSLPGAGFLAAINLAQGRGRDA